jgi:sugar fermentation stimulation protein A
MTGLAEPGSRVILSDSENPKRKLRYTWELVRVGRTWVGVNTGFTNKVAREALERNRIPELAGHDELRSEVRYGEHSRLDFLLEFGGKLCYVEVKSVTLAVEGVAQFPDAVTARGLKHLAELRSAKTAGHRAAMLFVVGRQDCRSFAPAEEVDPAYAAGLREAHQAGVEILVHATKLAPTGITLAASIPFVV